MKGFVFSETFTIDSAIGAAARAAYLAMALGYSKTAQRKGGKP